MADDDSRMTARDRRRQRAKSRGPDTGATFKRYRVHLAIVLIFGAIVAAMVVSAQQSKGCPGHWHSTQDFFVNGERVSYLHPKYDLNGARTYGGSMAVSAHMHNTGGNDYTWHFEPPTAQTCVEFSDALRVVDTRISDDTLTLDGQQSVTGTFRAGDNGTTLQAYHKVGDGPWEDISMGRLNDRQLRPDERVIVVYGNETTNDLDAFKATAEGHTIESSSSVRGGSYVSAIGVGVIGLIVLGGWHALSRKA